MRTSLFNFFDRFRIGLIGDAKKQPRMSDDVQLVSIVQDLIPRPAPIPPVIVPNPPHFGARLSGGAVPAGELTSVRIQAPADRPIFIVVLQNAGSAIQQVSISATDHGTGYVDITNPFTTWSGVPLAFPQRGGMTIPAPFGPILQLTRAAGTPGPHIIIPRAFEIPPSNFFYVFGQVANSVIDVSIVFNEPIP